VQDIIDAYERAESKKGPTTFRDAERS